MEKSPPDLNDNQNDSDDSNDSFNYNADEMNPEIQCRCHVHHTHCYQPTSPIFLHTQNFCPLYTPPCCFLASPCVNGCVQPLCPNQQIYQNVYPAHSMYPHVCTVYNSIVVYDCGHYNYPLQVPDYNCFTPLNDEAQSQRQAQSQYEEQAQYEEQPQYEEQSRYEEQPEYEAQSQYNPQTQYEDQPPHEVQSQYEAQHKPQAESFESNAYMYNARELNSNTYQEPTHATTFPQFFELPPPQRSMSPEYARLNRQPIAPIGPPRNLQQQWQNEYGMEENQFNEARYMEHDDGMMGATAQQGPSKKQTIQAPKQEKNENFKWPRAEDKTETDQLCHTMQNLGISHEKPKEETGEEDETSPYSGFQIFKLVDSSDEEQEFKEFKLWGN